MDAFASITLLLMLILDCIASNDQYSAHAYGATGGINQRCDLALFPKTGCEDLDGAECGEDKRCRCKSGNAYVLLDRFCFPHSCGNGQYWDRAKGRCEAQRKASPRPEENYCRHDYHCYGFRVRCQQMGWNYNCVCETGFAYNENEGQCRPRYGIGGYCKTDHDCDDSGLRKMTCRRSDQDDSAQCSCLDGYRFNYNVDGCESVEQIAERENQMRTMIFIFIAAGLIFGLAMTCNFGFFSRPPKHLSQELIMKRLKQEEEKYRRKMAAKAAGEEETDPEAALPPPLPEPEPLTCKEKLITLT